MKLYTITADYRKDNPKKPSYYVMASSAKEAKERFKSIVSWLDIYGCEECAEDKTKNILSHPEHYAIF